MKDIKISLIVTAYNLEKEIGKCLKSLVNQSYKNIEILIINDGSTDKTLDVIKEFVEVDGRINYIDQKNSGILRSRFIGIEKALGEYITFVDGDDFLAEEAIAQLVEVLFIEDIDILTFGFKYFFDDLGVVEKFKNLNGQCSKIDDYLKAILNNEVMPSMWGKVMKKEFLKSCNLNLNEEISFAEDLYFNSNIAVKNPNCFKLEKSLYFYYQKSNSITKKITEKVFHTKTVMAEIEKMLIRENLKEKYKEEYDYCVYLHLYKNRFYDLYPENIYSKRIFKNWKSMGINLDRNKYYIEETKKFSNRGKLVNKLRLKNYYFGKLLMGKGKKI